MVILNQILQNATLLFQWSEYNSQSDHLNFQIFSRFIYEDWTLSSDEERSASLIIQSS